MFGVSATMRRTIGDDIDGACGQLRNKNLKESGVSNHQGKKLDDAKKQKTEKVVQKTYKTSTNKDAKASKRGSNVVSKGQNVDKNTKKYRKSR